MAAKPMSFELVEQKRRAFAAALRTFRVQKGQYHNPAPDLPAAKLVGCEVLASRESLFEKLPKGGLVAKIGIGQGDFVPEILNLCQPEKLHLFDADVSRLSNPEARAEMTRENSRIKMHIGNSAVSMSKMPNGYFNVIYIDGDHSYEAVTADISAAIPRIAPGGALVFNDYTVWSSVSMFHCGVARAVHELALAHPWKFRYLALQPMMYNNVMLIRE
tara:strand:- start:2487 stop:3137 length:651 start_codon:yes stop_codon:yes gene_type:complete